MTDEIPDADARYKVVTVTPCPGELRLADKANAVTPAKLEQLLNAGWRIDDGTAVDVPIAANDRPAFCHILILKREGWRDGGGD